MKRKLGFITALVFALSLSLSTAFAQSTKPGKQSVGQQGETKTASTSVKSGMKSKMMSKKSVSRHHRHHRKITRNAKNGEKVGKEKKAKNKRS